MVHMKDIPAWTGRSAERFVEISESNLSRRASVDFSKEAENSFAILNKKPKNK